ncbi:histone acetyltransferase HAC1-like [Silene latifolia]|uniref:histone acetyltransferase HAC1-like n=1 Tax=Silene latifolia TaxID=37657 RepID=UPI003D77C74C
MSGQFSGQVPNQAANQLPGLLEQNGNSFHTQVQNFNGQNNPSVMDTEVLRIRRFMRDKIYETLMLRQSQPNEAFSKRCQDITKRLEEGLFKSATTKEEYMNMNTLETRLQVLVKRPTPINHAPQHSQFINATIPGATMMPTPGMPQNGNPNVNVSSAVAPTMMTAGTDGSMSSSIPTTGNLMSTVNGSFSGMRGGSFCAGEGSLSNGYQQSTSSFSMNSGGNNMMIGQRPMSQMMPTPGYSGSNNQTLINVENSNKGMFSGADSPVVSQQMPQRQASGQNSRMLQNLGSGMRSLLQHRFQNGTLNSGFGNSVQMVNGSGLSDTYLTAPSFDASFRPLLQPQDALQRPAVQGDSSGPGSFYNTGASVESLINNQNVNQVRSSSTPRSSPLVSVQMNSQPLQSVSFMMMPHSAEQDEKVNFQSTLTLVGNDTQCSTTQYQQHVHQIPHQQQSTTYGQQRQPTEMTQTSVKSETFQSQFVSDYGNHVKSENGMEHQNEIFQPQGSSGNLPRNSQFPSLPSASQDMHSTLMQVHQPMMTDEHTNEFSTQPHEAQSEALLNSHWHSINDRTSLAGNLSHEHVQEEFRYLIVGNDETPCINLSSEVSSNGQIVAPGSIVDQPRLGCDDSSLNEHRDRNYRNQLKWLLFLRHARWCKAPAGKCAESRCIMAQQLLEHLDSCKAVTCLYPRCAHTRRILAHQTNCREINCPVCVPFKKFIYAQKKLRTCQDSNGLQRSISKPSKSSETVEPQPKVTVQPSEKVVESPKNQLFVKRLKSELPSQSFTPEYGSMFAPVNGISSSHAPHSVQSNEYEKNDDFLHNKYEYPDLKADNSSGSLHNQNGTEIKNTTADIGSSHRFHSGSALNDTSSLPKEETVKLEKDNGQFKPEEVVQPSEQGAGTKSGKPKIKGVSLIELFTPEQVREHITGLRQWVGQSKAKVEKNQAMEQAMSENSCQLCAVEKLSFEPPSIYCTPCGARIKRNAPYYTAGAGDTRHYFCISCYNEARGDTIVVDGTAMSKGRMEKKKNDDETEEWWVQCDRCEAWQHQICALFNGRRNDGGQAEYTCPNCYILEVERGERTPLPQSAVLGAKDLPTTVLSDHIEKRLFKRLRHERLERARSQGKSYDEVLGADDIVVRVVSSVDKKLEVKPRFLEIFRDENYPMEFPYKSKVVLLFQKIEGVEVCLYGMYVQEFGSECLPPNQRRVYLSYLDSVKYFRPDVRAVTGEALRTFVYHEILIGYLDYCKKRGFASCYIWACPPLKGEDYILYCHPEIQKTPKSDKLREWYLAMLRKAIRENIVVDLTNLHDNFFMKTGESKAKVTAARLPYFDGDYWPGAAEDIINQINQEEEGRKLNKKGTIKKTITKRVLKASGQLDLSSNASKDIILMHKLGETIAPMKEDFIMVHLQHACTHCCVLMVSGNRWVCELCKSFELCDRCYDEELKRDLRERHPINQKDKHGLKKIEITDVSEDTKDKDEILESEFFDTRQAFLSLCQGNHYQYDTLRRAKHSSMMVLYHLHNPTAPAFVITCCICRLDIETGQGWRCETCPDYDVCNACYQNGVIDHPHKLTNHPTIADRDAQNKEARQQRVVQLRKMLELLVHASQCRSPTCQYPNCRKVKGLFRHGIQCRTRASGGCGLCKKMWYLLQLHARACKESECHVPRCRDLKEHVRRLQQQSDSRRRAAVMEMMRQRAKEVADYS